MKKTATLAFLIGLTIQAFIAGFLGKLEIITISGGQQFTAASMLAILAALFLLFAVLTDQEIFLIQVVEFSGMAVQALLSGILIDAGILDLATYQLQLNLGIVYLLVLATLVWEWRGEIKFS